MKDLKDLKTDVMLVYSTSFNETTGTDDLVLHHVIFKSKNALMRFGEFLSTVNGSDAFDICELFEDKEPVGSRVILDFYDDEHPFTENIEEDLDSDTSIVDSVESDC